MKRVRRGAADIAFWEKVDKGDEDWHCWEWTACTNQCGYGVFDMGYGTRLSHRLSYRFHNCYPVEPEVVMHICDNPRCVNPLHMTGGTQADNIADRSRKSRQPLGSKNGFAKLSSEQAVYAFTSEDSNAQLAQELGVCAQTIHAVRSGRTWGHVTGANQ